MSTGALRSWRAAIPDRLVSDQRIVFVESVVTITIVWWLFAAGFDLTDTISSPVLVATAAYELAVSLEWVPHLVATLRRTLYGFVVTVVVGAGLGLLMGFSDFWEEALKDYVIVGLALPSLFAAVFAAMWFGISDVTPTVAGALIAFPFVTQNVYEAVEALDVGLVEMSQSFGVSRNRLVKRVVVQSIMPAFFAGARYAFSICWKITTLAELVAAENGIGFMIEAQLHNRSITGVITWTLLFTLVILVIEYGIFQQIEARVFDWREESEIAW